MHSSSGPNMAWGTLVFAWSEMFTVYPVPLIHSTLSVYPLAFG